MPNYERRSSVKATYTKEEMLAGLRDAFLCGVTAGRSDESGKKDQEDLEDYRAEVDKQYEPFWPGELLMVGFWDEHDLVHEAEHEGWLKKQQAVQCATT